MLQGAPTKPFFLPQARTLCWSRDDVTHVKHADIWVKHLVYHTVQPNLMYDQREENSNVLEVDVQAVPSRSKSVVPSRFKCVTPGTCNSVWTQQTVVANMEIMGYNEKC